MPKNQSVTYRQYLTSENRLYCLVVLEASLTNSSSAGSHFWRWDSHLIMYNFGHMDDPLIQCSSSSHIFLLVTCFKLAYKIVGLHMAFSYILYLV